MRPGELRLFAVLGGLLVLVMGVLLTAVSYPAPHTGGDNTGYLALAHALVEGLGYTELWDPEVLPHSKYPPGFSLLLAALMGLGADSWTAFKLLSAVLVSGAVLLVFAWVSRRRGPVAGAAVAFLTLLSTGWLEASRWILSEPAFLAWTFLALWAFEQAPREEGARGHRGWLLLAGAAALAAFWTRSAGLPLVLAILGAMLLTRRFRAAAVFGLVAFVPAVGWVLRARRGGEGAYQSEFWMVNPYEPALGTVGWLDLPVRAWTNLRLYVGEVVPGEWWGGVTGLPLAVLGILLFGLAALGWGQGMYRWVRPQVSGGEAPTTGEAGNGRTVDWGSGHGAAELFVPLYFGLILVWPEVWSGDRFILPLYPLLLLYAAEGVYQLMGRVRLGHAARIGVLGVGVLLLAVPAVPGWLGMADEAAACRRIVDRTDDVFACHGEGFREFRSAAAWAGANLPPEAVVLNRKPRIHFVLGGQRGRTYPFTHDPDRFLEAADRTGAQYLLMDYVDGISFYYLPDVIRGRPLAFCYIRGWGGGGGRPGTDLFGILPPEERRMGGELNDLELCPDAMLSDAPAEVPAEGRRIPLRAGLGVGLQPPLDSSP